MSWWGRARGGHLLSNVAVMSSSRSDLIPQVRVCELPPALKLAGSLYEKLKPTVMFSGATGNACCEWHGARRGVSQTSRAL